VTRFERRRYGGEKAPCRQELVMRVLLIPVALVLAGSACTDGSLVAPEVAAAPALIDSVTAQSTAAPLVIVDGIIQQTT
jgi:hypothetical protein